MRHNKPGRAPRVLHRWNVGDADQHYKPERPIPPREHRTWLTVLGIVIVLLTALFAGAIFECARTGPVTAKTLDGFR